jgi:hypothetical protein
MQRKLIYALFAIAVVAAAILWFFKTYEKVEVEVVSDVSEEVRRNQLLAAERFFEANGYEVESTTGRSLLKKLPPVDDTLIVNNFFSSLTKEKEQELLDWISDGGHLMLTPRIFWTKEKKSGYPLLDDLGIERRGFELSIFGVDLENYSADSGIDFKVPGVDEPVEAWFSRTSWLVLDDWNPDYSIPYRGIGSEGDDDEKKEKTPGLAEIIEEAEKTQDDDRQRYHLVQTAVGNGLITVTSDNRFMHNEYIGDLDHAWLLTLLTDTRGKIWLLYDKSMPSLWELFVRHGSPVLVALALLLFLAIWHSMRRAGPVLGTDETSRRDLVEHLDATSRYHWRNDNREHVTGATQKQVLDFWHRQHSFLARMDQDQQVEWISVHSGLEKDDIRLALFSDVENSEQLVRQAQTLQLLRLRIYRG